MCGIAGYSGRFDSALLKAMSDAMAHRGPDDSGLWQELADGVGLAHRRLSIIDLTDAGHQPMWDATRRACIVYNGELYNYRELRARLREQGFAFHSETDTEVLLNLYLRDGEKMLDALNGIFAFALWDTVRRRLFLARDPFGVKPLYYAPTDHGFLFASEIKSLLRAPSLPRELDLEAVRHYLAYLWCPAPRTALRAVRKVPPGNALFVTDGRVDASWRYFPSPYDRMPDRLDDEEAVAAVDRHLRQAVERQMVADVPVGAFLSGGLDSSAIVSYARECTGRRLQCFTIELQDDAFAREGFVDDLPYAEAVARELDVELHRIRVGPEMAEEVPRMVWHLDEPQADPAPINAYFICKLARAHGMKVLLSGAGGDDILTGYRRHWALLQERYWSWLPAGARCLLASAAASLPPSRPLLRRLGRAFRFASYNPDERIAGYFRWLDPRERYSLYGPALSQAARREGFSAPLMATLAELPRCVPRLNRMLALEARHFLADHNLNYTDKMGMAVGVEVRVPFLDPELVALAARLPLRCKQRGRVGKWVLRRAMASRLPSRIIDRPKTGFGAPLRAWLRGPLQPLVEDLLCARTVAARGLFDPRGVASLIARDRAGRVDGAYTLFALMCMELWCRQFVDR